ncbi:MAG: LysM peptidoglycan-binding domain-containing protein [Prevotellaceae bacterium]|nr:LysM peptidoglycan-binding domain-containing protein [Prevotellaceae bacterium]
MKKISLTVGALLLLMGMSSCSHRLTDFTMISTKNVPLGAEAATLQKANQRVKGVDKASTILVFPIGTPNLKEAIDKAIEKYPGAVGLVDGVVRSKSWWAFLYGQSSYVVEGTPLYQGGTQTPTNVSTGSEQSGQTMVFFHEVKEGETLSTIAAAYNVSVADIIKWNQLSSSDVDKGTKLKILVK